MGGARSSCKPRPLDLLIAPKKVIARASLGIEIRASPTASLPTGAYAVVISGVHEPLPTDSGSPAPADWDLRDEIRKFLEIELPTADTGALKATASQPTVMNASHC